MDWLALTLTCAFSIAAADITTKWYFPDYSARDLLLIRFTIPALILMPLCWIFPMPDLPIQFYFLIAILVVLEILAMYLYILAIRDYPLHLTLPYLAFTPIFNILTGYVVLNETISLVGVFGILLIFTSTYILNQQQNIHFWYQFTINIRAIAINRGSQLMILAAGIYSVTSVLSKQAMEFANPLSFGPFYFAVIGTATLILCLTINPKQLKVLVLRPGPTLLLGGLMSIMVITHFLAIAQIEVAYMLSVKRISLLIGILFGAILFKEKNLNRNLVAGLLMVAGVTLILNQDLLTGFLNQLKHAHSTS